eukprot:gene49841-25294_t
MGLDIPPKVLRRKKQPGLVEFHAAFVDVLLGASGQGTVDAVQGDRGRFDRGRVVLNASRLCVGHRAASAHAAVRASSGIEGGDGDDAPASPAVERLTVLA